MVIVVTAVALVVGTVAGVFLCGIGAFRSGGCHGSVIGRFVVETGTWTVAVAVVVVTVVSALTVIVVLAGARCVLTFAVCSLIVAVERSCCMVGSVVACISGVFAFSCSVAYLSYTRTLAFLFIAVHHCSIIENRLNVK